MSFIARQSPRAPFSCHAPQRAPFSCHAPQRPAFRPALSAKHARARILRAGAAAGVTDETFEAEVIKAPVPVLIDFWAPWCGPCRMIAPLIDEIAEEYKGRVKCVKLNTDESPNTASELGIRSIPTVIIYKDGKKCETIIGAVPKSTLVSALEKFL